MAAPLCHEVQFRFADGAEYSVVVPQGSSVLEAALEHDVPLLFQCRSGTCSSCAGHLEEGAAEMRAGQASVLLASEAAAGMRLLCCTEARSMCRFTLDYDSKASGGGPRKASAFVDKVERITPDAVRLILELAEGDWIDFKPGQFVQVGIPGTDCYRSYSIASTPDELPRIELLIRLLPSGQMSHWLTEVVKPDAVLELEGPFGAFFLSEKPRKPIIMIAGGTGLAPMMAMIDTIRAQPGRKPPILLSFGCASPEGLFNRDELALRQHWMPGLEVRTSVDRDAGEPGLLLGNPVGAVGAADVQDEETAAYLCGPPALIEAARAHLQKLGIKPQNIHAEQFVASQ